MMLSNRLGVRYPVFLVLGGLALGLVPIVPEIGLPLDLVLLIFLPPLLYSAAFFSSPRDLKANLRPIASVSIGLVLLTTLSESFINDGTALVAVKRATVTRNAPWHTSVSGGNCSVPSVRSSSGSGAKGASATR
jgi:NhaP-type Na+/H+ or K+/H+ antiporter